MALNTRFNAKNGLSVGIPNIPVIDSSRNATFVSVSASQYLGLQPSLSSVVALVNGNSLGSTLVIGTNDGFDLSLETNGVERAKITSGGLFSADGVSFGKGGGGVLGCIAIGEDTLLSNTLGGDNVGIGSSALTINTTGFNNVALGSYSLLSNTSGSDNMAIGGSALTTNSIGIQNTAIGSSSLYNAVTGSNNVAIGYYAGSETAGALGVTDISSSVLIGNLTKPYNATGDINSVIIGDSAGGMGSNTVVLGNNSITNTYLKGTVQLHRSNADPVNYERLAMRWNSLVATIGTSQLGTGVARDLALETGGTTKMTVTSGGNVGIGTTAPTSKLEIVDTTSAINLSGAALNISHTWNAAGIDVTAIKLNVNSSASGTNSKLLDLQIGGTSYFKVDKTGATTMASAVFVNGGNSNLWNSAYTTTNTNSANWSSVYTTVNTNSASYIVNGGNTLGGTVTIGTNDANNFNLETNGTVRVSMSSTGQVGIGTTTPDTDLVVYKNVIGAPTTLKIRTATGTGSRLDFYRTDAYVATRFDVLSTNEFQFFNNNDVATPKYIVNGTNGNFGIGTTNTVHKVTIGGSLSASGTLYGDCASLGDATNNVFLERDAAHTLGQRNGTAAQSFNVYGTYTSGTIFERLTLNASSLGGVIGHYAGGGGGVARDLLFQTNNTTRMTIAVGGSVNVAGHFSAATKSFLIDHPTQKGKKLQYGVVESNQHSVLVRGKTTESIIELPEEWAGLVHEDSVTVQLTPLDSYQQLYVVSQDNLRVVVGGSTGLYNYTIFGERKDVNKLQTEI